MSTDGHCLDGHVYLVDTPSWVPYCSCGWTAIKAYDVRAYDEHIVAVVLDHERSRIEAEIREQKADAWDEGLAAGVNLDLGDWEHPPDEYTNPYREDSHD